MDRRMRDGRNPYGSRGGYVTSRRSRRGRRGDRGMDYAQDMRGSGSQYSMRRYRDMNEYNDMRGGDYAQHQGSNMDMRGDYRGNDMGDMAYGYDRANQNYGDMRMDGHYGMHGGRQSGYEPIEFMGYCSGYYGSPDQDYGDMRGRGRNYADYDYARGGRGRGRDYGDYGYPMYEHDYSDYGDYGETLSEQELEHWNKKLLSQLEEREKQMFSKDAIMQKAKSMGKQMEGFGEKELYTTVLMIYTDYKQTIGQNVDVAIKLAFDWLNDKDVKVKGAEKLACYYDDIVMGGEEE
jgi:hypothetical protein